jgi:hypothetical protein
MPPVERSPITFTAGDIICSSTCNLSREGVLSLSKEAYDLYMVGVCTNTPSSVVNQEYITDGIAYVKFNSENGIIHRGDLVTSSSSKGVAMKAMKPGMVLGIALEDAKTADGLIQIRVMIHYGN